MALGKFRSVTQKITRSFANIGSVVGMPGQLTAESMAIVLSAGAKLLPEGVKPKLVDCGVGNGHGLCVASLLGFESATGFDFYANVSTLEQGLATVEMWRRAHFGKETHVEMRAGEIHLRPGQVGRRRLFSMSSNRK
jgi:hypothetical protein